MTKRKRMSPVINPINIYYHNFTFIIYPYWIRNLLDITILEGLVQYEVHLEDDEVELEDGLIVFLSPLLGCCFQLHKLLPW